jgi:hypothetical protein
MKYSEQEAGEILDSALRYSDLEASLWSSDDLIQIAAELDIPEQAMREAIARFERSPQSTVSVNTRGYLKAAAWGAGIAVFSIVFETGLIPQMILMFTSIGLSLDARRLSAYRAYCLRNAALWVAFYSVMTLNYGLADHPAVLAIATGSCVGAGLIALTAIRLLQPQNPVARITRRVLRAFNKVWKDGSEVDPSSPHFAIAVR